MLEILHKKTQVSLGTTTSLGRRNHTRLDARRFWQDQSDTVPRSNGGVVSSVSPAATAKAMKPPAAHNSIAMMKGMRVASYARAKPRQ
jgi:hypothetical protein